MQGLAWPCSGKFDINTNQIHRKAAAHGKGSALLLGWLSNRGISGVASSSRGCTTSRSLGGALLPFTTARDPKFMAAPPQMTSPELHERLEPGWRRAADGSTLLMKPSTLVGKPDINLKHTITPPGHGWSGVADIPRIRMAQWEFSPSTR